MNIVVAVRCYNEIKNIERFMRGYDFADTIVVSDGGSVDGSVELLNSFPQVQLLHFDNQETVNGETWNEDAPHMNFVLDAAKKLEPDWLIFDDMDCCPNKFLRMEARELMASCSHVQMNAFRLYMWGEDMYFPYMNRNFHQDYTSLWAWRPKDIDIRADENVRHGTIIGTTPYAHRLSIPNCLLHYSWHPDTIQKKIDRYNALGLPMEHPLDFAGTPEVLPEWATL